MQAMDTGHLHFVGRKTDGKDGSHRRPSYLICRPCLGRPPAGVTTSFKVIRPRFMFAAAIVIVKSWGGHMIGRVGCARPEDAVHAARARVRLNGSGATVIASTKQSRTARKWRSISTIPGAS